MASEILGNTVGEYYAYALKRGRVPAFAGSFFKTGDVAGLAGAINVTYGALVFDQINREVNAFAIVKKEVWERSGWRITNSDATTKGYGGADPGTVGTVVDATPTEAYDIPGFLHTPFDVTMDAAFRAQHDDGLDILAWKRAMMRDQHAQLLNTEWLRSAEAEAGAAGGATTDAKNESSGTVIGLGLESLDRLIASGAEEDDLGGAQTGYYDVLAGQTAERDTGTSFDSEVFRPDGTQGTFGTNVPFQVTGLDEAIDKTEDNGADPSTQVLLCGRGSRRKFYNELQAAGRYDLTSVQAKLDMGGLSVSATHPGRDITFTIRAYQDRPFVSDKFVPSNGTTQTTNAAAGGGTGTQHIFGIDQRHVMLQVGFPTLFVEIDNPIIRGQFDTKALYLTCLQGKVTRFNTSFKVRSIS